MNNKWCVPNSENIADSKKPKISQKVLKTMFQKKTPDIF